MPDRELVSGNRQAEDLQFEVGLRPRRLADFTGQSKLKENLSIAIEAARKRGEAMDHVLLYGPPGLGKTTLASIIAEELGVPFTTTSGPVLQKKLDLTGILSNIRLHQVFFIDEIHRLMPDVEEMLYSALEDFRVDILVGVGPGARTHSLPMPKYTAIGATTRQGLVSAPLRGRFGLVLRLDPYSVAELHSIVKRSAKLLNVEVEDGAGEEIARRCRGTPRIANRLLRRVRDYAEVRADGRITKTVAQKALDLLDVDRYGLDEIDQKIMMTILEKYRGGPVGVNTIAASISEESETIEEVYEPYLIQLGFLNRTPRGPRGHGTGVRVLQGEAQAAGWRAAGLVLKRIYLSLGSNIGDREANLRKAVERLAANDVRVLHTSRIYETEPVDYTDQAWFLNQVVEAETALFPMQLLTRIGRVERELGRIRTLRNGPRTIDIDILFYGAAVVETTRLEIPHPRIAERRFVLAPLAELAPDLRHPVTQRSVRQMLESAPPAVVRLLHS